MLIAAKRVGAFAGEVVREFTADDCSSLAASLAFYTVFSLASVLVVVVFVAGIFVSPEQAGAAVDGQLRVVAGDEGVVLMRSIVEHLQSHPNGTWLTRAVGVMAMLLGGNGMMLQLQSALNRVWRAEQKPSRGLRRFFMRRLLSLGMILVLASLLLVSLAATATVTALSETASSLLPVGLSLGSLEALNLTVSLLAITVLLGAMFKLMPDARVRWRDVAFGSLVTTVLLLIGKAAIGAYIGFSGFGSAYGTASTLAVLLVWVYYSWTIVLLGAEITEVWARRDTVGEVPRRTGSRAAQRTA